MSNRVKQNSGLKTSLTQNNTAWYLQNLRWHLHSFLRQWRSRWSSTPTRRLRWRRWAAWWSPPGQFLAQCHSHRWRSTGNGSGRWWSTPGSPPTATKCRCPASVSERNQRILLCFLSDFSLLHLMAINKAPTLLWVRTKTAQTCWWKEREWW